jgi:hypothetical protein
MILNWAKEIKYISDFRCENIWNNWFFNNLTDIISKNIWTKTNNYRNLTEKKPSIVLISTFLLLMEEIKNSYLSTAMMNIINDDAEQMQ